MAFGKKTDLPHIKRYQGDSVPIPFRVTQKKIDSNKTKPVNITDWGFELVIDHGFEDKDDRTIQVIAGTITNQVEGTVEFPFTMNLPLDREFYYTVRSTSDAGHVKTHGLGIISAIENIAYVPPLEA